MTILFCCRGLLIRRLWASHPWSGRTLKVKVEETERRKEKEGLDETWDAQFIFFFIVLILRS